MDVQISSYNTPYYIVPYRLNLRVDCSICSSISPILSMNFFISFLTTDNPCIIVEKSLAEWRVKFWPANRFLAATTCARSTLSSVLILALLGDTLDADVSL